MKETSTSTKDDDDSDVEMEGMDLDGDEEAEEEAMDDNDDEEAAAPESAAENDAQVDKLEHEDHDELEEAKRERMELMAAEAKQIAAPSDKIGGKASVEEQLQYLLGQSEVFAHFLAGTLLFDLQGSLMLPCEMSLDPLNHFFLCGLRIIFAETGIVTVLFTIGSVAAASKKKGKKGSRGKKGRMTEAEEDEQMLKSAQSKRRVIRLDVQPSILASHCKMHAYQLEGLNWLVKLHCNGINGILADEVSILFTECPCFGPIVQTNIVCHHGQL